MVALEMTCILLFAEFLLPAARRNMVSIIFLLQIESYNSIYMVIG